MDRQTHDDDYNTSKNRHSYVSRSYKKNKCSAVAEIGDHLATIDMGRKEGSCALFREELNPHPIQCGRDRGLPLYQVLS